jgi:hypothetical protein
MAQMQDDKDVGPLNRKEKELIRFLRLLGNGKVTIMVQDSLPVRSVEHDWKAEKSVKFT